MIRAASVNDIEYLVELLTDLIYNQTKLDTILGNQDFTVPNVRPRIEAMLSNPYCIFLVYEENGQILGFMDAWIIDFDPHFPPGKHIYISNFNQKKCKENKHTYNIILKLFKEVENIAKEKEIQYLVADVNANNSRMVTFGHRVGMEKYMYRIAKNIME